MLTSRSTHVLATLALMTLLAACSSDDSDPEASGTTGPAATTSSPAAETPLRPTSTQSLPIDRVPLKQLETARVPITGGGGPDWMATGFGSLWVKQDDNVISRIAPDGSTEATIEPLSFVQPVCQGVGVGEKAVWSCANEGKLARIDPRTNKAEIIEIAKVNEQGRLVAYGGRIWVLIGDGDQLVGIDEATSKPGPTIALDAFCTDVADQVVGSTLWVVCPYDDAVLRVDLEDGEVTGRIGGLAGVASVTASDAGVWACTEKGVAQLDPQALSITAYQRIPAGSLSSLRTIGDSVWVRSGYPDADFVTRIDPATGQVDLAVTDTLPPSGGDVIEFADALWVSAVDLETLFKLRPPEPSR